VTDLSILIPARNEMFLARTCQDILANMRGDTEIIVVLDGAPASPPLPDDKRVQVIYKSPPVGQRAATNLAARMSSARYVMKVDAHCAFDEGFDAKMLEAIQGHGDWTMAPIMRNLHIFDWVCENGHRRYQGPSGPCAECGQPTHMDIVWIAKPSPQSKSYCFDPEPHFQYFGEFNKRPEGKGDITESMSLQGSCFMVTRDKYFELDLCDEAFGSWGSQGIEVAVKTWLSGGRVMINHHTWYAHLFRTQGGDFGFPWPCSGRQVEHAKKSVREIFFNNAWPKQVYPLSWLVEKFWPVPGWKEEDLAKIKTRMHEIKQAPALRPTAGIVYYTDCRLDPTIMRACQEQLKRSTNGNRIVSVSLQPLEFGENIHLALERGYLTMFKQILAGLEALDTDIVFLCEHDILYHPSHFDFVPPRQDVYYYNENVWKVRTSDGHALHYDCKQTSGLCAYRSLLLQHYRERVRRVEAEGFSRKMGFEPGTHGRAERVDDYKAEAWKSEYPNIDIRHEYNLTPSRWRKDQFRDQRNCRDWKEADASEIPGWEIPKSGVGKFLEEMSI
jgi:glycosyltransferase involved in cell wall biosynthesis